MSHPWCFSSLASNKAGGRKCSLSCSGRKCTCDHICKWWMFHWYVGLTKGSWTVFKVGGCWWCTLTNQPSNQTTHQPLTVSWVGRGRLKQRCGSGGFLLFSFKVTYCNFMFKMFNWFVTGIPAIHNVPIELVEFQLRDFYGVSWEDRFFFPKKVGFIRNT